VTPEVPATLHRQPDGSTPIDYELYFNQEFPGQLKTRGQVAILVRTLRNMTEAVERHACGAAHSEQKIPF